MIVNCEILLSHPRAPLALLDLIPGHRHPAADSVQPGTTLLLVPRVLSVKQAALLLKRGLLYARNVLRDHSLVLENVSVVCVLPNC